MVTKKVKKIVKQESSEKDLSKKKIASKSAKSKPTTVKKVSAKKTVMVTNVAEKEVLNNNGNAYVIVDHPCENEVISGNTYVIRIGASFDGYVEISFNDGEWQPCRFASGYWWFDWMYYKTGNCKISARLVANDGTIIKLSDIRKCKVS